MYRFHMYICVCIMYDALVANVCFMIYIDIFGLRPK